MFRAVVGASRTSAFRTDVTASGAECDSTSSAQPRDSPLPLPCRNAVFSFLEPNDIVGIPNTVVVTSEILSRCAVAMRVNELRWGTDLTLCVGVFAIETLRFAPTLHFLPMRATRSGRLANRGAAQACSMELPVSPPCDALATTPSFLRVAPTKKPAALPCCCRLDLYARVPGCVRDRCPSRFCANLDELKR